MEGKQSKKEAMQQVQEHLKNAGVMIQARRKSIDEDFQKLQESADEMNPQASLKDNFPRRAGQLLPPDAPKRNSGSFKEPSALRRGSAGAGRKISHTGSPSPPPGPGVGGRRVSGVFEDVSQLQASLAVLAHQETDKVYTKKDPVIQALSKKPLFRHCSNGFLTMLASSAAKRHLEIEEELHLDAESDNMLVLEQGAVRVCVGPGPEVIFGPGLVLNVKALISGSREKPSVSAADSPYELLDAPSSHIANVFEPYLPDNEMLFTGNLTGDQLCFYSLCPYASFNVRKASLKHVSAGGSLELTVAAAGKGEAPFTKCDRADFMAGGATFLEINERLIHTVAGERFKADLGKFQQNSADMLARSKLVQKRCGSIFVAAPSEFLWSLAEIAEHKIVEAGECIMHESSGAPDSETLFIIVRGEAYVVKQIGISPNEAEERGIGKLGAGAIIGDWVFFSAGLPRPASVVAASNVELLAFTSDKLCQIIKQYPGTLAGMENRLNKAASFMKARLTGNPSESLLLCNIFAGRSEEFLQRIGEVIHSQVYFCGQAITDDSDEVESNHEEEENFFKGSGSLYCLEFGTCTLQSQGRGTLLELQQGSSLKSCDVHKTDTLCASSPLVMLLALEMKVLRQVLRQFPADRARFLQNTDPATVMRNVIKEIKVFKPCCNEFVDDLCSKGLTCSNYMPGQTVCVMGAEDQAQMFMLRRGQVAVEVGGKRVATMNAGATFGELVMLGVTQTRTATIRATAFSSMLEIPRVPFWEAIEQFPEERGHFEQLAMTNMRIKTSWPFLAGIPSRLGLLLNLQAVRKAVQAGDQSLNNEKAKETAMLLLSGEAALMSPEGREIEILKEGDCYNEQALIGIPNYDGTYLLPKAASEIQIVATDVWEKVASNFAAERHTITRNILASMIQKALRRCGWFQSFNNFLRKLALFRTASDELLDKVSSRLEPRAFKPGDAILVAGQEGDTMYILLDGVALLGKSIGKEAVAEFIAGDSLGEAVMIGAAKTHACTVRAKSLCIAQALSRADFKSALQELGPEVQEAFDTMLEEVRGRDAGVSLQQKLKKASAFKHCSNSFLALAGKDADDVLFAPGDVLLVKGDVCQAGKSPIYLILSGSCLVEGDLGVVLSEVSPGEIMGEGAALGLSSRRTATVRAGKNGFVHCARLHGQHLEAALNSSEDVQAEFLAELHDRRQTDNNAAMKRWMAWLEKQVLPALRTCPLFSDWNMDLLKVLVAPLSEDTYAPGDIITQVGSPADSMIVLLSGDAEVETKNGTKIGLLRAGAMTGGEAALGIFGIRTYTLRAVGQCTVLILPLLELQRVLDSAGAEETKQNIMMLKESRFEQVKSGLPLVALPLSISPEDVCARAVAMQSHRILLAPGEIWEPLPDASREGPHFGVLVAGKALIEVGGTKTLPVMRLWPGNLVLEGVLSKHSAYVKAITACECYTVRKCDFVAAVDSIETSQGWYPRYRVYEKQVRQKLLSALQSAMGVNAALQPHRHGADLQDWKIRHLDTIKQSAEIRQDFGDALGFSSMVGLCRPRSAMLMTPNDKSLMPLSACSTVKTIRPPSPSGTERSAGTVLPRNRSLPAQDMIAQKLASYPILSVLLEPPAVRDLSRPSSRGSSAARRRKVKDKQPPGVRW